ncbi:MAG: hypothetical protein JWO37_3050 [Acidimicrobiales bacterium]|nr:hypothetical protein [Acidimicrobiales bacterium]
MVGVIAGPFAAVAALLVAAGVAKLAAASGARGRVLGAAEVAVGGYAVLAGNRLGALVVAAAYGAFTAVVLTRWVRSGAAASCQCFGARPSRVTPVHALVDLGAAAVAGLAALHPPGSLAAVLGHQPVAGVPFVIASATVAYLAYLTMTAEVAAGP